MESREILICLAANRRVIPSVRQWRDSAMSLNLIDMKQTSALTGLHHLYLRRMIRAKKFPAPVRIVGNRTRLFFNVKEVRA